MEVEEPLEREGGVPKEAMAKASDARRLAVGGGVGGHHVFDS